ncbi:MAG: tetratricopeptide repeat protein, partial [Bacteroidota bacterium]
MSHLRIFLLALSLLFSSAALAQKSTFKKADKYYAAKSYSKAIPLYEEGLKKNDNLSAKNKLATCYRLTNQTSKARDTYAEIVTNDRARPKTYFYYGESLMQSGRYEEARVWFLKYADLQPDDEKGRKMAEACERVRLIRPVFPEARIRFFPQNSDSDDTAPVFYKNGIVFSTDRESGLKALKGKSEWTGRGNVHLYFSEQLDDTLFTKPVNFSGKLNASKKNTGTASFSQDESEVFFARNSWQANKKGLYTMQLFSAKTSGGGKWKDIVPLSFCSIKFNYMHPSLSPDGMQLFFISDKPGGFGGMDIYVSKRVGRGWKKPVNLGEFVNTDGHEGFPFFFDDGRLFFCSKGHEGLGGFDIFYTEQDTLGVWQKPVNIGPPFNSPFDDVSFHLSDDATKGVFTSGREGGDDDIFLFELSEVTTDQLVNRIHMAKAMKGDWVKSEKPSTTQPSDEMPVPPSVEPAASAPETNTRVVETTATDPQPAPRDKEPEEVTELVTQRKQETPVAEAAKPAEMPTQYSSMEKKTDTFGTPQEPVVQDVAEDTSINQPGQSTLPMPTMVEPSMTKKQKKKQRRKKEK